MLIQTFVLKVINNEKNILTHHEIIDRIDRIYKLCRCAKNQYCGFIRTYDGQISHLIIHLSSLTFVL